MPENRDSDANGIRGVSIGDAMRELRRRPRHLWLDLVRADQSDRWRHGRGLRAEEYFSQAPELRNDSEEALVLICGEIQLRANPASGQAWTSIGSDSRRSQMKSPCNSMWIESWRMDMR